MNTMGLKIGDRVMTPKKKITYVIEDFLDKGTHVSAFIVPFNKYHGSTWWPIKELVSVDGNQRTFDF